jgi:hypothetical protein
VTRSVPGCMNILRCVRNTISACGNFKFPSATPVFHTPGTLDSPENLFALVCGSGGAFSRGSGRSRSAPSTASPRGPFSCALRRPRSTAGR